MYRQMGELPQEVHEWGLTKAFDSDDWKQGQQVRERICQKDTEREND